MKTNDFAFYRKRIRQTQEKIAMQDQKVNHQNLNQRMKSQ
jgi:hypothetical protein